MANPVRFECPADTWVKIASAVKAVTIRPKLCYSETTRFAVTYRALGSGDPADDEPRLPIREDKICIKSAAPVDVFVMACGAAGHVAVFDVEMAFV